MFGRMMIEPLVQVDPGADPQSAIVALVKVTENVDIVRWNSESSRKPTPGPCTQAHPRVGRFSST
jgi:hypothetical protein